MKDELENVLAAIDDLLARMRAGLTSADRRMGWREDYLRSWIEILEETKGELSSGRTDPSELWITRGVARELDAFGATEGDLAEALYSLAYEIRDLALRHGDSRAR